MELPEWRSVVPEPAAGALGVGDADLPLFTGHAVLSGDFPPQPAAGAPVPASVDVSPSRLKVPNHHGGAPAGVQLDGMPSLDVLKDLRPIGQLHESFIIAAGKDGLWIVDQHVAHERILFEQVLKQRAAGRLEKQQLLIPMVLELTAGQQIEYARIADELGASGFESEPFGNRTIAIKTAPVDVKPGQIERILFEILEVAERELRGASLDELRRNIAASIACQAAIKINMRLDQTKMDWLLAKLSECEYPTNCPHGRPIALRYSTREILKGFHRI